MAVSIVFRHRVQQALRLTALVALTALAGCSFAPKEAGIGEAVSWQSLDGWQKDQQAEVWPGLLLQCNKLRKKSADWQRICTAADQLDNPNNQQARVFFEKHFQVYRINGTEGRKDGLITGYYTPLLYGSLQKSERYSYPLYQKPADMLGIQVKSCADRSARCRGRVIGDQVMPYYSRAEIDGPGQPLAGQELLWVDDPNAAFFLHIQGSGVIQLDTGELVSVGYKDQNGHAYKPIGRVLVDNGEVAREDISLDSINQWLETNPQRADWLKNQNPSYVFFYLSDKTESGPRGSLNVPLTNERSVAVDRKIIPLGTPLWLSTTLFDNSDYQRLVLAQDTGGAIKGPVRADVFFGRGERAKRLAGHMKQSGELFALLPKPR
ncbi:murein transglycosylase A [Aliamphritea ceti]|uniref:murein transglycosylase A n=1 Tax=Aliamphritea ceti TaxID=1524258 RepID=UPI0021C33E00|nr:MltA domain-containing protein [Aliamphritea ceti]